MTRVMSRLFSDLFVFEIANNHQGSLEHGLQIVRAMGALARAHAINAGLKCQYRDLDSFIHPQYRDRTDVAHVQRFLETRLSDSDFRSLVGAVRDEGMVSVCTPFDERSVEQAVAHDVQILKVASCSADDWPLLEVVAAANKPVIMSTGGLGLRGIDSLATFAANRGLDYALLHCVAAYPSPRSLLNMNFLTRMIRRYPGVPVGYSGHEDPGDVDVVKVAVSKGASILERHVGIPISTQPLNRYSLTPEQASAWVQAALVARTIGGSGETRDPGAEELAALRSLKRGVYAARPIARDMKITPRDVMLAMPCVAGQTTSGEFSHYRARFVASREYGRFDPIFETGEPDLISFTRDIIHEAKGMVNEAGIAVGRDVEVELSHHYGPARFRETGAILISVINREYCKKLVLVLPGQQHPAHFHKVKEETFLLLWGDLEVALGDSRVGLAPGDRLLVPPGVTHGFRSVRGAIFEEVSTKSVRSDSYYLDEQIRKLDPMERKTVLDGW
ncbi:MAG: N-acetylneuraminate synthase family protein [Vicinamibacterales bacterium]